MNIKRPLQSVFKPTPLLFPSLSALRWLLLSLVLVVLPHLSRLPIWILPLFFTIIGWRYLCTVKQWGLPSPSVRVLITFAVVFSIFVSYRGFGREPGTALLIMMCGLKLIEMNSSRDALLVCFLSYFLVITSFLYSQTMATALYMMGVMIVITATLISLSDVNDSLPAHRRLRLSANLLTQAMPLTVVFFLLFPRIPGPFWSIPKDAQQNIVSGLSDTLSLGNLSEMTLSDEIAFRVKFADRIPPSSQRYWRGPVLWWSNGQDWKQSTLSKINPEMMTTVLQPLGKTFTYTVTLEPHEKKWLLALDIPTQFPHSAIMTSDYQLTAARNIRERIRYEAQSVTEFRADLFTPQQQERALQLPHNKHLQTRALAQRWLQEYQQPQQIIERALRYFREEPFVYTLAPPPLLKDPVDEFLFEIREGFCEHYAVAFTVLMRAAGIPTRIVTGYLGGTFNRLDGYLVIRQRDAHAWTEVWLENQGWIRIDPTGAVAPERIESGIDISFPQFTPFGFEIKLDYDNPLFATWRRMREFWEAFDNKWNQWILSYDNKQQRHLLEWLGLGHLKWRNMLILSIFIVIGLLLVIAIWLSLRSQKTKHDPAQQLYLRFCQMLARKGLSRSPSEGPITYSARVRVAYPELSTHVQEIVDLYVQIRYCDQRNYLPQLHRAIKRFRL